MAGTVGTGYFVVDKLKDGDINRAGLEVFLEVTSFGWSEWFGLLLCDVYDWIEPQAHGDPDYDFMKAHPRGDDWDGPRL